MSPDFESFWAVYPRKQGKKDACKAWDKIEPDIHVVLAALAWQRIQPAWTKDGGRYIPLPATWLRGERWTDEPHETMQPEDVTRAWVPFVCPHVPRCDGRWACDLKQRLRR